MTAIPLRRQTLEALTDTLSAISIADGYHFDMGVAPEAPEGRVFRGRAAYGDNDPIPMLSIIEDPRNNTSQTLSSTAGSVTSILTWPLLVQGFVDDDSLHPTDLAYDLLADVRAALFGEIALRGRVHNLFNLGGAADQMEIGGGVVRPSDEVSAKAYFWLPVTLTLIEKNVKAFT